MASDTNNSFEGRTVTVDELINHLQKFDKHMPVAYTWEGQILPVRLDCIEIESEFRGNFPDTMVILDAET